LHADREVKKATRELSHLLSNIEAPMNRLDTVQKKYAQLLAEMKRVEHDHKKAKKRADQLQKEKDAARSELSKANQAKDRLEKLSRDLSVDNRKLKVSCTWLTRAMCVTQHGWHLTWCTDGAPEVGKERLRRKGGTT